MTIVDLIPKASRPYVGSSANDTVWNLAVGYNGFGRITGSTGFGGRGGVGADGCASGQGGGRQIVRGNDRAVRAEPARSAGRRPAAHRRAWVRADPAVRP